MTYAQGASAGLVTMATIFAADTWGLPVSTTHILSSGVAGTMAANGSGLRWSTVRNIAAGWVFTLPAAALLSGLLYFLFHTCSEILSKLAAIAEGRPALPGAFFARSKQRELRRRGERTRRIRYHTGWCLLRE